ncbi:acetyltransferase GNAT family protein [Variibacter gotjawalensis]|uniref:Acetyltransferase GNAT family protein n=1 Tax=Variibacter gotjawalensis TaxID=1333996 RepID=A0A0S3PVV8_9BRAD|nr:GNAT family N-acetyltransferase [Variibacter gotjawalensis]NIK45873.1 ribosomal-protein-alanine N-acetyltransferase [Variibacter gotjawalensis]RZS47796.1 RimJ/RimL family protein N-acetyltransferase [Variibacter gotjawalensis]BAT60050.1 acetyltransferase GNAT family protein [Variibacter gotjawalensis]
MEHETDRLILRRTRISDAPELFSFLGDPEAMRHTHVDVSLKACRQRIAAYDWQRRIDGFTPWTIESKQARRIIGLGGLLNDPFDKGWGVEVAYWFHPSAWGQGYASELVAAALTLADEDFQLPLVNAFARAENAPSRRVLEKAGFVPLRYVPDLERTQYQRHRTVS